VPAIGELMDEHTALVDQAHRVRQDLSAGNPAAAMSRLDSLVADLERRPDPEPGGRLEPEPWVVGGVPQNDDHRPPQPVGFVESTPNERAPDPPALVRREDRQRRKRQRLPGAAVVAVDRGHAEQDVADDRLPV